MKNILLKLKYDEGGVSLLELVVAMGIFVVVSLLANGIYINVINSQKLSISSQTTQEALRFAFEMMGKELRTAQGNFEGSKCASTTPMSIPSSQEGYYKIFNGADNAGATTTTDLFFTNKYGECVRYNVELDRMVIRRATTTDLITTGYITPNELKINSLKFLINDTRADIVGTFQPSVTMMIEAEMLNGPKQNIRMQTTVSSREYTY